MLREADENGDGVISKRASSQYILRNAPAVHACAGAGAAHAVRGGRERGWRDQQARKFTVYYA